MRVSRLAVGAAALAAALALASCSHRLVASGGEAAVKVYTDEATFAKVKELRKQGGVAGMLGGLGEDLLVKQVDDKTTVKIISSDSEGAEIEVLDGQNKGLKGFVAKENVD